MKKITLFTLFCLLLFGCTNENRDSFETINGTSVIDKVSNKDTFLVMLSADDCYSCDMLKEEITEVAKKHSLHIYEVIVTDLSESELDQLTISLGEYTTWPTLIYVDKGEIPPTNRYEYTLDAEGWKTWLSNMKLIKEEK